MKLRPTDVAVLGAYFASLALIGWWCAREQKSRRDYHLGGGRIHWLLAGGSVLVTLISSLTFLAAPGEMIRYGIGFFAGAIALPLVAPVINRYLIPALRSLPATSMYEYLEVRFHPRIRTLAAAVFVFRATLWVGLIIYSCTLATVELSGLEFYTTLVLTGVLTTAYATAGGFKSVVWTDNLQLVVLLGGAMAVPVFVWWSLGTAPWEWWPQFADSGRTHLEWFSFDPRVRLTLIGIIATQFFWNICANASDQAAAQRYLATPDIRTAQRSVWVFTTANLVLIVLLALCGLALFAWYTAKGGADLGARADKLMPMFIAQELPAGLSGLLLAALLAAGMSSISSGVNSISTVATSDLIRSSSPALRLDKALTAAAGVAGIAMACVMAWSANRAGWNLIELTSRINNLLVGPMAVFFFGGIWLRRANANSAMAGFLAAAAVAVAISFGGLVLGPEWAVSFTWLVPASFGTGLAITAIWPARQKEGAALQADSGAQAATTKSSA